MSGDLILGGLMAVLLAAPLLLDRYLRQLPVAPSCPCCRCVAQQAGMQWAVVTWIPAFARTFLAECTRCGWRGRMRWSLARDPARR